MMLTTALYGATVLLVLAGIILAQYKRSRRVQPVLYGLDPLPSTEAAKVTLSKKRSNRVGSALRAWTAERAEADLVVPSRPAEPERTTVSQPKWELQTTTHAPRTAPAVEAPQWGDSSEWMAEPASGPSSSYAEPVSEPFASYAEPVSEPLASYAEPVSEPFASYAEPVSEPSASDAKPAGGPSDAEQDRFTPPEAPLSQNVDYYEVLQISPNADAETIHRVYRIMAARFHPDNPTTGSLERFLQLREAYQTLSDPVLRGEYDSSRPNWTETMPIFWQKSFVDGIEGETNRRLGVLSLLYQRRRINESKPGISVMELERRMAFPREYLNFTLWYLRQKGYVTVLQDNSDYALTSDGVDYVENGSNTNKVIRELLTAGTGVDYTQQIVRPKVVPFPRTAARARVEGSRRMLRRRQAGRR